MFANEIRMLYSQLKACYRNEFHEYLVRDDTYIPYDNKCKAPKKDIYEFYFMNNYHRLDDVKVSVEGNMQRRVDDAVLIFNYFGWSGKHSRNIALNYNYDNLNTNVWTNEPMSNKSMESYGGQTIGGKFGGNYDQKMMGLIDNYELAKQKHKNFDPKKTDDNYLQQTDKFWSPNDLPQNNE